MKQADVHKGNGRRRRKRQTGLSLTVKLFLTYLVLFYIPVITLLLYFQNKSKAEAEDAYIEMYEPIFNQTAAYLEYKMKAYKDYLNTMSYNNTLIAGLKQKTDGVNDSLAFWNAQVMEMRGILLRHSLSKELESFTIYSDSPLTDISEREDFRKLSSLEQEGLPRLISRRETFLWQVENRTAQDHYLSVYKGIIDYDAEGDFLGVIQIQVSTGDMIELLENNSLYPETSTYLCNPGTGEMIRTKNAKPVEAAIFAEYLKKFSIYMYGEVKWSRSEIEGEACLAMYEKIPGTPYLLVSTVPKKVVISNQMKAYLQIYYLLAGLSVIILPLAYFMIHHTLKRMHDLIEYMKAVQDGNYTIPILRGGNDEIGSLTRHFNVMLTKILLLMDEKYELGQENSHLELMAVQAQINPHFLYNSLDQIYWKTMQSEDQDVPKMVYALSQYYKLSLQKGRDIVALEDELQHVRFYLKIQNIRYKDKIFYQEYIPENYLSYHMPKITLQPFVENAVLHGILEKDEGSGLIEIAAFVKGGEFVIEIRDDGVGIPPEKLESIGKKNTDAQTHGYGLYNVERRIQLFFGKEGYVSYESMPGYGTTAVLHLPENNRPV